MVPVSLPPDHLARPRTAVNVPPSGTPRDAQSEAAGVVSPLLGQDQLSGDRHSRLVVVQPIGLDEPDRGCSVAGLGVAVHAVDPRGGTLDPGCALLPWFRWSRLGVP